MQFSQLRRLRVLPGNGLLTGYRLLQIFLVPILCCGLGQSAQARSQWEIQHPTLPADQDGTYVPGQTPGQLHKGMPPQLSKNFWQGGQYPSLANSIQPGVVLTGVMEDELTSAKAKPGDIFAITLQDGYVQNGLQVIPQKSKIVGAVTAVAPAKTQRGGMPGNLQVALQSLVFPDGAHVPFAGFIAVNPNHSYKKQPKKRSLGFDMKDAGSAIGGMLTPYTSHVGYLVKKQYQGNDFYIDKDEEVPVRLNKLLVIPEQEVKPVAAAAPTGLPPGVTPGIVPGITPGTAAVPGLIPNGLPPGVTPGIVPGITPGTTASGLPPGVTRGVVPGITPGTTGIPAGVTPAIIPGITPGTTASGAPQGIPGLSGEPDPFNAPVNPGAQSKPLKDMPEPF